jgi:hypothetical protein
VSPVPDDRDLEAVGLGHRDPLAVGSTMKTAPGTAHLADAAEDRIELGELLLELGGFLLGQPLELAGLLAGLELVEEARSAS